MRMELIQPFINSADAVLAQGLESPVSVENLSMEDEGYRRQGVAVEVRITGDIEGRILFDVAQEVATSFASRLSGMQVAGTDGLVREAVGELANQIIGNAVTVLNDQGFQFRVHPPTVPISDGSKGSADTEALVMCFRTECGIVFMNIALRYHHPWASERAAGTV